ncbi:hypothetical protein EJ02DRAFT_467572 [Clathrospora elynae]|uniref:Uncharacterized protein n=1 Tax=Clathrospora elynae TaxID=706981 RepID=A0A6A5SHU7_9PLEO|nr:hypothetical protein EJ02DRAFT_467572 [Clathrospora elynae]
MTQSLPTISRQIPKMATPDPSKYVMHASKGFSYLVTINVQVTLTALLKQIPPTARDIYREYYRDLMAAKACAQDSANDMVMFVEKGFPKISADYNQLAKLMNEKIDQHEHSYVPLRKRRAAPAKNSRPKAKRIKTGKKLREPKAAILATPESELRATSRSLPLQPAIVDEKEATHLPNLTPPLSAHEPSDVDNAEVAQAQTVIIAPVHDL